MKLSPKAKKLAAVGAGIGGVALTAAILARIRALKKSNQLRREAEHSPVSTPVHAPLHSSKPVVPSTSSKSRLQADEMENTVNNLLKRLNTTNIDNFHTILEDILKNEYSRDIVYQIRERILNWYVEESFKLVDGLPYTEDQIPILEQTMSRLTQVFEMTNLELELIPDLMLYIGLKIRFINLLKDFKEQGELVNNCDVAAEILRSEPMKNKGTLDGRVKKFLKHHCEQRKEVSIQIPQDVPANVSIPNKVFVEEQRPETGSYLNSAVGGVQSLFGGVTKGLSSWWYGGQSNQVSSAKKNQMKSPKRRTAKKSVKVSRSRRPVKRPGKANIAHKASPALWKKSRQHAVKQLGGKWSARAAQLATKLYKKSGGKYRGKKSPTNSLTVWTREEWGTKSGNASGKTGERYLPKLVRQRLSPAEYARTTSKKRMDTRRGLQWSPQPASIRRKTSRIRKSVLSKSRPRTRKV